MGSKFIPLLIALFFAFSSCASAYNITYFLSNHPEFNSFNYLLTKTGLDKSINRLNSTITVLAIDNSAISPLSSQPKSSQQSMLAAHILFDYFDSDKLKQMRIPRSVTNLYQKTGKTTGQQGITSIAKTNGGDIIFYSPINGAPKNSKLVKEVGSKPFDIIVLQISTPIIVPGLNSTPIASPPAESPSPVSSPESSPIPSPSNAPVPSPSDDGDLADGPEAESPKAAASSPAPSPSIPPEEAPADDDEKLDDKEKKKSSGGKIIANVGGLAVGLILTLALAL